MKKLFLRLAIIIFTFLFSNQSLFAQSPPPGSDAGAQAQRYKTGVDEEKKRLEFKKPKPPDITVEEKPEEGITKGPSFVLKGLKVSGSTIFDTQELELIYGPFIGRTVSYNDLNNIISLIKDKYKEKGYLTTTAYLPEQNISGGLVEIRVQEGKMGTLTIENNRWAKDALIRRFVHSKKMKF